MNKLPVLLTLTILLTGLTAAGAVSVDQVTYNSNSNFFNGEVFTIDYVANGDTDAIDLTIPASELDSATDGKVDQNLRLQVAHQDTYARYTIRNTNKLKIYNWDAIKRGGFTSTSSLRDWAEQNCFNLGTESNPQWAYYNEYYDWDQFRTEYRGYCVRTNGYYGNIGEVETPDEIFSTTWELKADGKTVQTATITNGDTGAGVISNLGSHAKIRWNGGLDTGNNPPDHGKVLALHSNRLKTSSGYETGWKVISRDRYNDYTSFLDTAYNNEIAQWANQDNGYSESQVEASFNSVAEEAQSEYTEHPLSSAEVTDTSWTDGQLRYTMERMLAYPSFTIYVNAGANGYVEVYKPVGEPRIISTTGDRWGETGEGHIQAVVENVGDYEGSFSGRLQSCSTGFSFDDTQQTVRLNPGERYTYDFQVSFSSTSSSSGEISGSCTVEVVETGSGERVTSTASVTGVQDAECISGNRKKETKTNSAGKEYDVIYQCKENELGWNEVTQCSPDQKAAPREGLLQCVDDTNTGGGEGGGGATDCTIVLFSTPAGEDVTITDPICAVSKQVSTMVGLAEAIITLIVAGVAFGYTSRWWADYVAPPIAKAQNRLNEQQLRVTLGVFGAIIVGWFTYTVISRWWMKLLLLIGLIVYGYVKTSLSGIAGLVSSS